jgi:hypothetical protein
MKTLSWRIEGVVMVAAFGLLAATALGQGSLTPPGAPTPSMKSLQELWAAISNVEARVSSVAAQAQSARADQGITASMLIDLARAQSTTVTRVWQVQTVDWPGDVGKYNSLAFTPAGYPAISYYDDSSNDLKYAVYNGSTWVTQTVDSAGAVGTYTSLAFKPSGRPAISYSAGGANNDLKYAEYNGVSWVIQTVDATGDIGWYTSLAFTPAGRPAISYCDNFLNVLKYAEYTGTNWVLQTVDSMGDVGAYNSLAFTPGGQPAISYYSYGTTNDLEYAECTGVRIGP